MKLSEIDNVIQDFELTQDAPNETVLHLDSESFDFFTPDKQEYERIEKEINDFEIKRDQYDVYMWCDVSGYDYWVNNMCEPNYIQISVDFKTDDFDRDNILQLENDLTEAYWKAEELSTDINEYFNYKEEH